MTNAVSSETPTRQPTGHESPGASTQFRVIRREYVMEESRGEEGGVTECDNSLKRKIVIKVGKSKDAGNLDAHKLKMDLANFPEYPDCPDQEESEGYAPQVGDRTYKYELQTQVGGEWKFVKSIEPYREETQKENSSSPRLKLIEESEIVDGKGEIIFDSYELLSNRYPYSSVIIATPNIPLAKLDALKRDLRRDADGDSLDLSAIIYSSLKGTDSIVKARWELGWDDGDSVFVHIYPKEFFDSQPDAREIFDQKIVPSLLS